MKLSVNSPCPCGSGQKYKKCCQKFHKGVLAKNALELMKSRYSAYVFKEIEYIIKTTHENHPDFNLDKNVWKNDIIEFCNHSEFRKLDIIEFIDGEMEAFVSFRASIFLDGKDASFTEKSRFKKHDNRWLYHSGEIN
jgi:SEC-C motif-containing protein